MYTPPAFREDRIEVLHNFIRTHPFATLVTATRDGLVATHIPLIVLPDEGPHGCLIGHTARANEHWKQLPQAPESLAMFLGPNAYVSPTWYPNKHETGRDVPTWNYIAVHAYGPVEIFDHPERLLDMLKRLTDASEAGRPDAWRVGDAPEDYTREQMKFIVGIRMPIARIEGKWKLSQNRDARDRAGAKAGLAASSKPMDRQIADLMPGDEP